MIESGIFIPFLGGESVKIIVKQDFYDRENDFVLRKAGDELEVSEERGKALIELGYASEPEQEPEKKSKTTKSKK